MYLHQQFELLGAVPATLTRVSGYRGLSSRSIRVRAFLRRDSHFLRVLFTLKTDGLCIYKLQTLLVHMQKSNRKFNIRTLSEEQKVCTTQIFFSAGCLFNFQQFLALRDAVYAKKIRDGCAAPPPEC